MKKKLLSAVLFICFLSGAYGQTVNCTNYMPFHQTFMEHPETLQKSNNLSRSQIYEQIGMRHDTLNAIDSIWSAVDSMVNYYDNEGNITVSYQYVLGNGIWNNSIKTEYTLNSTGTTDTFVTQKQWDEEDSVYISWQRTVYSNYGNDDSLTRETHQYWNASDASWDNVYQYERRKNETFILVSSIYETYDSGIAGWDYIFDTIFKTYSGNNPNSFIVETFDSSGPLVSKHQIDVSYDKFFLPYLKTDSIAIPATGNVNRPYLKSVYTNPGFDGSGPVSAEFDSSWDTSNNTYVPFHQQTYAYNANGYDSLHTSYYWGGFIGWSPFLENYYNYDNNSNIIYEEDITPSIFLDSTRYNRYYYYYQTTTTGISNVDSNFDMKVYPNPTGNNGSIISFTLENTAEMNIMVYDIKGCLVFSELKSFNAGANKINIVTKRLSSGIYTIKLLNRNNGSLNVSKLAKE